MDDLLDMIASDESASQISDKIKDILFSKSAEKVDAFRPFASNSMFGEEELEIDTDEDEITDELDQEEE